MASPPPPPPKPGALSPAPTNQYERPPPPLPPGPPRSGAQLQASISSPASASAGPGLSNVQGGQLYAQAPAQQLGAELHVPKVLKNKSKADLEAVLQDSSLLSSLLNAPSTAHPALAASQEPLQAQLQANVALAQHVLTLEGQIQSLRSSLTPSLLRTAALERQFRAKQEEMDHALSPWAPKAVHTRLGQGIQEQDAWCRAMEESFLEGEGEGRAGDREVSEWLRKYREGRKLLELRREKRARLEEGRVGGWR